MTNQIKIKPFLPSDPPLVWIAFLALTIFVLGLTACFAADNHLIRIRLYGTQSELVSVELLTRDNTRLAERSVTVSGKTELSFAVDLADSQRNIVVVVARTGESHRDLLLSAVQVDSSYQSGRQLGLCRGMPLQGEDLVVRSRTEVPVSIPSRRPARPKDAPIDPDSYRRYGSNGRPVVFFGDSLAAGVGSCAETNKPAALLAEALGGREIVAAGISGETSSEVLQRIQQFPLDSTTLLVFWAGRNNYLNKRIVIDDLKELIKTHRNTIILSVVPPPASDDKSREQLRLDINELNGAIISSFPDNFLDISKDLDPADYWNPTHLTDSGYRKVIERLERLISARAY